MYQNMIKRKTVNRSENNGKADRISFVCFFLIVILLFVYKATHSVEVTYETHHFGVQYLAETDQAETDGSEETGEEASEAAELDNNTIEAADTETAPETGTGNEGSEGDAADADIETIADQNAAQAADPEESVITGKVVHEKLWDYHPFSFVFTIGEQGVNAIELNEYTNRFGRPFTDETLHFVLINENTGEILQSTDYLLAQQQVDDNSIYLALEKQIEAGTRVRLNISSSGLRQNSCIAFGAAELYENESELYIDEELMDYHLMADYTVRTTEYNYLQVILFLAAEILIFLILVYLHRYKQIPIINKKDRRLNSSGFAPRSWKKIIGSLLILDLLLLFVGDYVKTYAIDHILIEPDAEYAELGRDVGDTTLKLAEGENYEYYFSATKNELTGIAIGIVSSVQDDCLLTYSLSDDQGNQIVEKTVKAADLTRLNTVLFYQDAHYAEAGVADSYVILPLDTRISNAKDSAYRLNVSFSHHNGKSLKIIGKIAVQEDGLPHRAAAVMGVYSDKDFILDLFRMIEILLVGYFSVIYILVNRRRVRTETIFLLTALVTGFVFSILIPPSCVPDERGHIDAVYRLSNELLGIKDNIGALRIWKRVSDLMPSWENTMDLRTHSYRYIWENFGKKAEDTSLTIAFGANNALANTTFLHFLPLALGFTIARILGYSFATMLMLGRWINLFTIIIFMYLGIKKMPFGKTAFAIAGLLPMMMQQISAVSYDGIILGVAWLFIGYTFAIAYEQSFSVMEAAVLLFSAGILTMSKGGVYLPLLGLIFLIPAKKHAKLRTWIAAFLAMVPFGILFLAQYTIRIIRLFTKSTTTSINFTSTDAIYTMSYFVEHPKDFPRMLQNTFFIKGDNLLGEILGTRLGKLNINIPWYLVIAILILLFISVLPDEKETRFIDRKGKIWMGFIVLAGSALIMTGMLFAWTTIDSKYIYGLQGRYFYPYVPLILLIMRRPGLAWKSKNPGCLISMTVALNFAVSVFVIWCLYYLGI